MKKISLVKPFICFSVLIFTWNTLVFSQNGQPAIKEQIILPNGWKLSPAGRLIPVGDFPLNIAVSPSGKLAAITNNGQSTQSIELVDVQSERIIDSIEIKKSWFGLTFSKDGKSLFASGGNDNIIIRYSVRNNKLVPADTVRLGKPWPEKISVAGIAFDDAAGLLYAVTKENNSLYVMDQKSRKVISRHQLGGEGYTCLLSPDSKFLYATCWGCDKVMIFDTGKRDFITSIPVGDNPNDMCLTANGKYLFVANANDNSVSVIDTRTLKVLETLNSALYPGSPAGTTTNSVALSKDEKTLFIANADNNCLALFDVSKPGSSFSKGFIPTGWYPTSVRIAGNKILVANGKGLNSMANPYGPNPTSRATTVTYQSGGMEHKTKVQYIAGLFKGSLQILDIPAKSMMGRLSKAVYDNTPYSKAGELEAEGMDGNPVPRKVGDKSPVKYIFYIIKENRTYDQVLGDMPEGNGDPNLCLFGENITPNQHAIAREFVLLDNFYVNGEVSADGHNWTMGAYATDYLEKNWPTSYGGRGGSYPGEGARDIANNKGGFLWDNCKRMGVSYRSYGEFVEGRKPNVSVLKNHFCGNYIGWDLSIRDTVRFRWWKEDFDSLLAINSVPALSTIRFGNDHTEGLSLKKPTPFAHVADNDLAVGMFVNYLSHSPIWKESLVIIVEDDAQNGPDHVDAHRSTAYIAGGFVKKGFVDHTPYTTASLLRTIELILGLPPMSQYDAAATPLWRCLEKEPLHQPFEVRSCNVNLDLRNLAENAWQRKSEQMDFTKEDMANDSEFTEIIWKAVKGLASPCPPAVRAAFFNQTELEKD
ncbi:MAG: bifunctional YncE family protein/alkaline phosphatase family protein [Bacteroidales bacterium]